MCFRAQDQQPGSPHKAEIRYNHPVQGSPGANRQKWGFAECRNLELRAAGQGAHRAFSALTPTVGPFVEPVSIIPRVINK